MKQRVKLSIVVPVYNVIGYLEDCICSIIAQSFQDYELILVDDGSTDGSGELCEQLASTDCRVQVLHKANGGLSSARNAGLSMAVGEWISFIDSDDAIAPGYLESLMKAVSDETIDMVAVRGGRSFTEHLPHGTAGDVVDSLLLEPYEYMCMLMSQKVSNGTQFRLLRRDLLGDNPFPLGVLYEDMATTYRFVHKCHMIAYFPTSSLYWYRVNPQGITRQAYRHEKCSSAILVTRNLMEEMAVWYPDLIDLAASRCFATLRTIYAQAEDAGSDDANQLWAELRKYSIQTILAKDTRLRDRLSGLISLLGKPVFRCFCHVCRSAGMMA